MQDHQARADDYGVLSLKTKLIRVDGGVIHSDRNQTFDYDVSLNELNLYVTTMRQHQQKLTSNEIRTHKHQLSWGVNPGAW